MTTEQQRIADGLELLLNATNNRVRSAVYGVENKCNAADKNYLLEGEGLCKAAERATGDLLAAVAEYRAIAKQLVDFKVAASAPHQEPRE